MGKKSNPTKAGATGAGTQSAARKAARSTTRAVVKPARPAPEGAASAPGPDAEQDAATPARAEAAPDVPALKKAELLGAVVARSGVKKGQAKPVLEAVLAVLGEAVTEGRDLNLEPFGKLKIKRIQPGANGRVTVARLRQKGRGPAATAEDPDA